MRQQRAIRMLAGHMWPQVYVEPYGWIDVDMLDDKKPDVGVYSAKHILFGVEETFA